MKSFPNRFVLLFAGIGCFAVFATALTAIVQYKPWGVPDQRRAEYDAILAKLDHRDELIQRYAHKARPVVTVPVKIHDAGLQDPQSGGSHLFKIRNDGRESLQVSVASSDGCETTLEKSRIAPGESTEASISWTTGAESGEFEHKVVLRTNDPLKEEVELLVKGSIKSDLVAPESIAFAVCDPAIQTDCTFVVYSQTWDGFKIHHAQSDLDIFEWHAQPIDATEPDLDGTHATSAWRVRLWTTPMEYGRYSGNVTFEIETEDGRMIERSVAVRGKVRTPIIFHSPEMHRFDGLDIGTKFSGKEHQFHLLVRLRGDLERQIEVLDVQPPQLKATLTPQSKQGNYRLTVTIPEDCPMVVFNIPEKHGYVEVGDPQDRQFKNWFPLHGAVVPSPKTQGAGLSRR